MCKCVLCAKAGYRQCTTGQWLRLQGKSSWRFHHATQGDYTQLMNVRQRSALTQQQAGVAPLADTA